MDICVWDKCNNRCIMCTNPESPWPAWDGSFEYDYDSIVSRVEKSKQQFLADDSIYLSGGEPTIHPEFLRLLEYLRDNFPKQRIKLLTNGRRFIYPDFAAKIMAVNNRFEVDLSLYGPNSKVHDKVTKSHGSFKQTLAGLKNIIAHKQPGQVIGIRFVITRPSFRYIKEFIEMAAREGLTAADRLIIIFWEAEAKAVENDKDVAISFRETEPYLEAAYPLLRNFKELRLYHFPLCALSEKFWPHTWRTLPEKEITFLPECEDCRYKHLCLGVQTTYLDYREEGELAPISRDVKVEESGVVYQPIRRVIDESTK